MTAPTQSEIKAAIEYCEDIFPRHSNEYLETIRTILQSALDTQKAAGDAVKPVAWQVYNELVKEWTTAYVDKAKADQLVKDGYKVRPLYAALTGDCGGGDLVHTVYVVEDDFTHIFSTEKLAREFADTKECPCVISTYLIDNPERFYEAVQ